MTDVSTGTCINCGSAVETPYCSQCGQKYPPKKINLLALYTDFQSRIYGFDGMFPRTLRDLTIKPGQVAREFCSGNRVKYVGPVGYFFLTLTVFVLLMQIFEIDFYSFSKSNSPFDTGQSERQQKVSEEFTHFIARNMRIFSFLQIPIYSFFAWLFFRRNRLNMLEHSVLIFYVWGHVMWLSVLNIFLYVFFDWILSAWQILINTAFFAFACLGFYQGSKVRVFVKGMLVSIVSFFMFVLIFSLAGLAYIFTNPELLEKLKNMKN